MRNNKFAILIILNVVVYFATTMYSTRMDSNVYDMFGIQRDLVLSYHEYYRILTAPFTHGDIFHLAVNMIALNALIYPVITFTSEKFSLIIYGVAALVSGITVILFGTAFTVGSSGAVYGLFGVLIYFGIKEYLHGYHDLIKSLGPVIVMNLIISFMPGVSLEGHLGGLVAGLIASFIYDKYVNRRYF